MDRNYDKPYRGLPTEIRLEVWKLIIPETGIIQPPHPLSRIGDVEFPKLQTQLLRLNRQVHNEVLPIFSNIKVKLLPTVNCEQYWTQLSLALRSPILNNLELLFKRRDYRPISDLHRSYGVFLSKFLSMDMTHPLQTLIMDFDEVNHGRHGYHGGAGLTDWLTDDIAAATFAAAFLKRGLVREVHVNIREIPMEVMATWRVQSLERYVTFANPSLQGRVKAPTYVSFWERVTKIVGPDCGRKVHIETAFSPTGSSTGASHGSVLFTLDPE